MEHQFLRSLHLHAAVVIDVGAWHGLFTLFFARAVGKEGTVVAFEPNPRNCGQIKRNVTANEFTNVDVRDVALGAAAGTGVLIFDKVATGRGSIDKRRTPGQKSTMSVQVKIDSLDNQIKTAGCPEPDFVKIDAEGMEYQVLLGMKKLIQRRSPRLLIELHAVDYAEILHYVVSHGYTALSIESGEYVTSVQDLADTSHLYCEKVDN